MPVNYRIEKWREYHAPNPAMLRYLLVKEGYNVFQWSDRPGMIFARHKHDEDQCHWIVAGSLEIHIEELGSFVLSPGDRDFLPAHTYHSARVISEEPVIYLVGAKISVKPVKKRASKKKKKEPEYDSDNIDDFIKSIYG
jgi:quercetin dioxygenase-like cupin family protein